MARKKRILIRADGSRKIGMGHVVRCLAVADELKGRIPVEVRFVTRGHPECVSLIKKAGYDVATIPPKLSAKGEVDEALSILADFEPDLVVNDILDTPKGYVKEVSKMAKVVSFDDTGAGSAYADKVVFTTVRPKSRNLSNSSCIPGPGYVILRRPFMELRQKKFERKISENVRKILVCMGGSDPSNLTVKVLGALNILEGKISVSVVIGPAYSAVSRIKSAASKSKHDVKMVSNLDGRGMLDLMLGSDVGVASCGISAWEMGATGLPMITLCQSKFELEEVRIGDHNLAIHLGLGRTVSERTIVSSVEQLLREKDLRGKLSREGIRAVNGDGLKRTVDVLVGVLQNS